MAVKRVLESAVERELVRRVEAAGGIAEKVRAIGTRGFFDRIVLLPGPKIIFVECKRPRRGRFSAQQLVRHKAYRALGVVVAIVRQSADVDSLLADQ